MEKLRINLVLALRSLYSQLNPPIRYDLIKKYIGRGLCSYVYRNVIFVDPLLVPRCHGKVAACRLGVDNTTCLMALALFEYIGP